MAYGYPLELRERVVRSIVEDDWTLAEASETFDVCIRTISLWLKRWRAKKTLAALPQGGGAERKVTVEAEGWLEQWLTQDCDLSQDQLVERLAEKGVVVDRSTVSRALERMGWTRKKKSLMRAPGWSTEEAAKAARDWPRARCGPRRRPPRSPAGTTC